MVKEKPNQGQLYVLDPQGTRGTTLRTLLPYLQKEIKPPLPERWLDRGGLALCIDEGVPKVAPGSGFLQVLISPRLHQPTGHPG